MDRTRIEQAIREILEATLRLKRALGLEALPEARARINLLHQIIETHLPRGHPQTLDQIAVPTETLCDTGPG